MTCYATYLGVGETLHSYSGLAEVGDPLDAVDGHQLAVETRAVDAEVGRLEELSVPDRERPDPLLGRHVLLEDVLHQLSPGVELQREDDLVDVYRKYELVVVDGVVEALVVRQDFASALLPDVGAKKFPPLGRVVWKTARKTPIEKLDKPLALEITMYIFLPNKY